MRHRLRGPRRGVVACRFTQCRETSGHFAAATQAPAEQVEIAGSTLRWFRSSPEAERGFCGTCGGNLFWRRVEEGAAISVMAGTLDGPTGLWPERQIHTRSAGDCYDLPDVPAVAQSELG